MTLTLVKAHGIPTDHLFLMEPTFKDPTDALQPDREVIRGGGPNVQTATVREAERWTGAFEMALLSHAQQREWFDHQEWAIGRTRSWWMPSWVNDFELRQAIAPADTDCLLVKPGEFKFEEDRYGVLIIVKGARAFFFLATGYTGDAVLLSDEIGESLPLDSVQMISLVRRVRFDQDDFDWQFHSDAAVTLDFSVIEVLGEGVGS